ncbi:hypothetical protein Snas_2370 [Stackebrandtia nassauensis DSM 44728]|uniref:LamG domain protein jellyroll fold domain protein n=2 Tax=Stackebrandtia TaxID=283810 RepID=D3Q3L4_STANL|nr:hypothetical protein Snas_2370 [Stackebrandtia nassauensis DSM 44728]
MNSTIADTTPEYLGGSSLNLHDGANIYPGTDDDPAILGSGHLSLDGSTGYASTSDPLVNVEEGFTLIARARPTSVVSDHDMTVMALRGHNTNLVEIKYSAEAHAWRVVASKTDTADSETVTIDHRIPPLLEPTGQAIGVTYDAISGEMTLWVAGYAQTPKQVTFAGPWSITGFQVGRGIGDDAYFSGAIDEVRVYAGVCSPDLMYDLSGYYELPEL